MSELLRQAETDRAELILENVAAIVFVAADGTRTDLVANIGEQRHEQLDANGILVEVRMQDFIVPTSLLDPVGLITRDCRVEFEGLVFQPFAPTGTPLVQSSGRFDLVRRIHTVKVGTV